MVFLLSSLKLLWSQGFASVWSVDAIVNRFCILKERIFWLLDLLEYAYFEEYIEFAYAWKQVIVFL